VGQPFAVSGLMILLSETQNPPFVDNEKFPSSQLIIVEIIFV
jgi:hypothetical protein